MKIYLYIILFTLIFCNDFEINEEKEFIDMVFSNIINIINNCSLDHECVFSQINSLLNNLTDEGSNILFDYLKNDNCKNICTSRLSIIGTFSIIYEVCNYLCKE